MQKLIDGIHSFQSNIFGQRRGFFEHLAHGQQPEVLFITCADSRINPNLITQTDPGELFIVRNAGNLVAPHNPSALASAEGSAVEYAIDVLKVKHLIICGHSHCGAMKAVLDPDSAKSLPAVSAWLGHADATRRIMQTSYKHLSGDALLTATAQENVLVQLDHLRTLPSVAAALTRPDPIQLHAWVYKLETGQVFAYDRDEKQFLPVVSENGADPALRVPAANRNVPAPSHRI
ncbi:MAG: carbonic anhydrase [Myxococcaceae bacterium]|nr:carbonic anhydrase [Myxococcaceae bacterium]